jgi:hypothetical protein
MTRTSGPHTGDMLGAAEAGWRAQVEKLARLVAS